jgi:hypothetical protein
MTLVVRALRSMELLHPLSVPQLQRLAENLRIVSGGVRAVPGAGGFFPFLGQGRGASQAAGMDPLTPCDLLSPAPGT